jgi:hypothetical protein
MSENNNWREEAAEVLETVARDGLPEPRDLDVALDAIECAIDAQIASALKWRDAINDALTNWLSPIEDHEKPSDALQRLIRLEVMAALAPKVSQSAADLVAAAHKEWLAELNHDTDALMENARRDGLEEAARWHDEQGRFWMEKGREVSALDSQSGLNLLAKAAEHRKHAATIRALKGEDND